MNTYKVLGQAETINADTDYSLYTVPASTKTVVSKLRIVAKTAISKFRISVVPNGEVLAGKHAINYDEFIEPGIGKTILQGITLNAGDQIMIRANTGTSNLSFSLFGSEIS